ncbi:MAG: right-handed parallel beta-helix repeat-containing protein [Candidatus Desulfofervidus auxilii]|nr:right-handed parallel beta-helix repeat-containing protein [Candidatus Desulfofervidus auxilii]
MAEGTYNITSTLHYSTYDGDSGHKLTIQGAGADKTILDGGGSIQILYINTDADWNGGDAGGDVTIKGMSFKDGNGGVYVYGTSINITIKECAFLGNSGYGGVDARSDAGTVTITNNTFSGNSAGVGGGVDATSWSGTITITNNTFSGNSAENDGGGVYADSYSGTITITNNTFSGNSAADGGGVSVLSINVSTITITNNTFSENLAYWDGGGVYVYSDAGTITITNNTFSENSANYGGGGVYACSGSGTITITNNTFSGNSAADGGGVYTSSLGTVTITNNTFSENSANYGGGGVYAWLTYESAILNVYNNILFDNIANAGGYDGDDLYVNSDGDGNYIGCTINLYNNNFSGNADFDIGLSEDLYITLTDNYHHANNIQEDPLFVDAENGDFHLQSTSPCIDTGTNDAPHLPERDKDGKPRIIDGNGDNIAIVDMGAYESGNIICKGDFDQDGDVDGLDLAIFAEDFSRKDCDTGPICEGDFDGDDDVDELDLAVFAEDFGKTDCPVYE